MDKFAKKWQSFWFVVAAYDGHDVTEGNLSDRPWACVAYAGQRPFGSHWQIAKTFT